VNLLDEARLSEDLIGWEELEGIQELSQRILNNSNSSTICGHFSLSLIVYRKIFLWFLTILKHIINTVDEPST
jgi:hypothetical protein